MRRLETQFCPLEQHDMNDDTMMKTSTHSHSIEPKEYVIDQNLVHLIYENSHWSFVKVFRDKRKKSDFCFQNVLYLL